MRPAALLDRDGTVIELVHHCPLAPSVRDPRVIEHPDRKPGPGMLLRAAAEFGLALPRSVMVGDIDSDMAADRNARGGATILVRTGYGDRVTLPDPDIDRLAADMAEAGRIIETFCLARTTP